jgi:hypothetical protein
MALLTILLAHSSKDNVPLLVDLYISNAILAPLFEQDDHFLSRATTGYRKAKMLGSWLHSE